MKKVIFLIVLIIATTLVYDKADAQRRRVRRKFRKERRQDRRRVVRRANRRRNRRIVRRRFRRSRLVYRVRPARRRVAVLPTGHIVLTHRTRRYYYHRGLFYRPLDGRYVVVAAPRGIRIRTLPVGYYTVMAGPATYYYYQGMYYTRVTTGNETAYEVTKPPTGAVVPNLPEDASKVAIDEQDLYEYDSTLYKKVVEEDIEKYEVYGEVDDSVEEED